jgi:TRAP-type mannitol/chloroaromatic compound transport system permease small subunit
MNVEELELLYEDENKIVYKKKVRRPWVLVLAILGLLFYLVPGILFLILWAFWKKDVLVEVKK